VFLRYNENSCKTKQKGLKWQSGVATVRQGISYDVDLEKWQTAESLIPKLWRLFKSWNEAGRS
jgi:hypothetical protein